MIRSIKWVALCIMFAVVSTILYITIDSKWSADNNMGIWVTIGFFLAAGATILCFFNAVEVSDQMHKEHHHQ